MIVTFRKAKKIMRIALRESDGITIFDISGEICRSHVAATTLHPMIKSQVEQGRRKVLLNLENVEFVDSFGIGELLASYISIQNSGGRLKLASISPRLLLVFQVTQLTRVLDIQDDEEKALASFSKS